jgi:predicted Rossmann-fold nucleotide-binding protein
MKICVYCSSSALVDKSYFKATTKLAKIFAAEQIEVVYGGGAVGLMGTLEELMEAITFVFGDRAVEAVENSALPEAIKTELSQARKYMEGRGIMIDVTSGDELEIVKTLVRIKIEN